MPKPDHLNRIIRRTVGKALHRYEMIADGDHILVGVSGGADSLSLLWLLNDRRKRAPIDYHLTALFVDPGFDNSFAGQLQQYCCRAGFDFRIETTDFGIQAHSGTNRENPCFLCARLRRKRMFETAARLGCNTLALGHNKDDLIETFFLNICYAGETSTMLPLQPMFGGRFKVIRPLAYTDQGLIRQYAAQMNLPVHENPCPSAHRSRRQYLKDTLENLYASNPKIKGNIFRAIHHIKLDYLPSPTNRAASRLNPGQAL